MKKAYARVPVRDVHLPILVPKLGRYLDRIYAHGDVGGMAVVVSRHNPAQLPTIVQEFEVLQRLQLRGALLEHEELNAEKLKAVLINQYRLDARKEPQLTSPDRGRAVQLKAKEVYPGFMREFESYIDADDLQAILEASVLPQPKGIGAEDAQKHFLQWVSDGKSVKIALTKIVGGLSSGDMKTALSYLTRAPDIKHGLAGKFDIAHWDKLKRTLEDKLVEASL